MKIFFEFFSKGLPNLQFLTFVIGIKTEHKEIRLLNWEVLYNAEYRCKHRKN